MKLRTLLRWMPVAAGGLALMDAAAIEPARLKVGRLTVPVDRGGDGLVGLRLAHLSDLHVGGTGWRSATLAKAVDACNRESVDLIALTGDFISKASHVPAALDLLSILRTDVPRLAVFGNHDHVYGRRPMEQLASGLADLGIVVLRNEGLRLRLRDGAVWFVGVDDGYSERDDLERAERQLETDGSPRILLTHYPDVADRLLPGQYQLSLAGHSHGGQIRLPILDEIVSYRHARTRYTRGLYMVNGNPLHVSPGLGMSALPLRLFNLPEVTILTFEPVEETPAPSNSAEEGLRSPLLLPEPPFPRH